MVCESHGHHRTLIGNPVHVMAAGGRSEHRQDIQVLMTAYYMMPVMVPSVGGNLGTTDGNMLQWKSMEYVCAVAAAVV